MRLEYQGDSIRSCCLEQKKAVRLLGSDAARKLRTRLSDLKAASNVSELVAGRPHPYKGINERRFSLDLAGGKRLLLFQQPVLHQKKKMGESIGDWCKKSPL